MRQWLTPLLLTTLVQRGAALAATPHADYLLGLDVGHRTPKLHESANVATEVDDHGEIRQLPQNVITSVTTEVVYGSIMLLVLDPPRFARDPVVRFTSRTAITLVATKSGQGRLLLVKDSGVALSVSPQFPEAVRVDFNVTFFSGRDRQTFTQNMTMDGGSRLAKGISDQVPIPYKGKCLLPGFDEPATSSGNLQLNFDSGSVLDEVAPSASLLAGNSYGSIVLMPPVPVQEFLRSPLWQDTVAMAIAKMAFVPRLQVGTLMAAASAQMVTVDFWLIGSDAAEISQAARRVEKAGGASVIHVANCIRQNWENINQGSMDIAVYGRLIVRAPSPQTFVQNAAAAVQRAVARVATSPGQQDSRLSVTTVNVSLAVAENTVRLGFRVAYGNAMDRAVFCQDMSSDGGFKLVNSLNFLAPNFCLGQCRLLQVDQLQAVDPLAADTQQYRMLSFTMSQSDVVAGNPLMQEALAAVAAEIASVPASQVGLVLIPLQVNLVANFWVAASQTLTRKAIILRAKPTMQSEFARRTLVQLDKLDSQSRSKDAQREAHGSLTLEVAEPLRFANSTAVRESVRAAVAQVAGVLSSQVRSVDVFTGLWETSPNAVLVSFRMTFSSANTQEAFTRKIASDGGEELATTIGRTLPDPFKGKCRLPGQRLRKASNNAYGTMKIYAFLTDRFVRDSDVRARMANAIGEVASVSPRQVGMMLTAESAAVASIDFWVTSGPAAAREAAVRRVNSQWANYNLNNIRRPLGSGFYFSPAWLACGGTVRC